MLMPELPAYTGALHPQDKCWAWSGRSSKIAIRSIDSDAGGEAEVASDRGPLGGQGKLVDAGKGKFGMDLQFVSSAEECVAEASHQMASRWR